MLNTKFNINRNIIKIQISKKKKYMNIIDLYTCALVIFNANGHMCTLIVINIFRSRTYMHARSRPRTYVHRTYVFALSHKHFSNMGARLPKTYMHALKEHVCTSGLLSNSLEHTSTHAFNEHIFAPKNIITKVSKK
jgi:hypothetical protein